MANWLIPVKYETFDIDKAFHELAEVYWGKYNFNYDIGDIIYFYVTDPIAKVMYKFQVTQHAKNTEYPVSQKEYWKNRSELEGYQQDYAILKGLVKVDKPTLSRHYLIENQLIRPKDTLQSHKTDKFIKGKKDDKIELHENLLKFICEQFTTDITNTDYPDEANLENKSFPEGAKQTVQVNRYERNPEARAKCIEIHGARCEICTMSFAETYGLFAKDFIHVHHITPLHQISESYEVNPKTDLIPVCPNCHAMLHRHENGIPMTVERLKLLYEVSRSSKM